MDMKLTRTLRTNKGILGELTNALSTGPYFKASTLERAFITDTHLLPKVPVGTYKCIRHAPNHLPYETFMLVGVPDFQGKPVTGILIHKADFPDELDGCIALGKSAQTYNPLRIFESAKAFDDFMEMQRECDMFMLNVIG